MNGIRGYFVTRFVQAKKCRVKTMGWSFGLQRSSNFMIKLDMFTCGSAPLAVTGVAGLTQHWIKGDKQKQASRWNMMS